MFKLSKMHLAVFSALALGTACQANAASTSISGKVITGAAASGATVCLDSNRNKTCDSGEPQAQTSADGAFTLSVTAGDEARYPVIAEIPATATQAAYALEAPLGKYAAISPFTTLVQNEIDNDTGFSVTEAEGIVMRDFLLGSSELYQDYTATGGSADAKAKATVIADVFARQMGEAAKVTSLTTPARRAAALLYARNMAGQLAVKTIEAISAAGGDATKAADKIDLTNPDRAAILQILEREKLYDKVVTKPVKDVYPNSMMGSLSYDATTKRVKFSVISYKDGELLRIDPAATTPQVMALDNVAKAPVTRVASYAALPDGSMRVMTSAKSETVWTTMEVDLGGQTIPLSQLISASNSPSLIPAADNLSVTFQPGDKMWREHHTKHPYGPDQVVFASATKDTGVVSLEAWVKSKNDIYNAYDTLVGKIYGSTVLPGTYDTYFKPADASNPLGGGDIIGHNISAKVESKVGSYYTKTVGATTYLIVKASMLSRINSAAEKVYIFDAATKTIKFASYRDYVRHCLCWQRKLSISALNRIADALRKAGSPLITPATTASTSTGHYVLPAVTQGFAAAGSTPVAQSFCGGCVLGNCGACPVAEVIGMR